ncbi:MAG: GNAT family N-acetyltransferase [Desulfobacteraceae bacterium]|jgi:N-acetylglutamate synthase-like GNAT family acetyltransferase
MMQIEYLIERQELIPELARLSLMEWFYLRPMLTLEAQIEILRNHCGYRQIPTILVATSGDEILGSVALVPHSLKTRKCLSPWLDGVYVRPDHRKQGIASLLIRRIEEEASALGIRRLYLGTANAQAFYSRLGWQIIEKTANEGIMVSVMQKKVSVPSGALKPKVA